MNRSHFRTLSISFAVVLATVGAVGCTSSTDTSNPDETNNPSAGDETGGAAKAEEAINTYCPLSDHTCYHEYAGYSFKTLSYCATIGQAITGSTYGFLCVAEPPSGHYYLWIWSPTCKRGLTWQQC
jgi:hypothetical protein